MYIMNKKRDSIVNSAQCSSIYIGPEFELKAVPSGGGNIYRMGAYETEAIARAVLNDLLISSMANDIYYMPDDKRALILVRGLDEDRPDKFAGNGKKTVRRGGS